jgi:hypothetical protein
MAREDITIIIYAQRSRRMHRREGRGYEGECTVKGMWSGM